mmetsp:Transcript_43973/g.72695  ORF Transcript_43973/g.72695 Transcript_43973/m.72695 type:complete len:111 (-) Transcript_43973:32-364(-)
MQHQEQLHLERIRMALINLEQAVVLVAICLVRDFAGDFDSLYIFLIFASLVFGELQLAIAVSCEYMRRIFFYLYLCGHCDMTPCMFFFFCDVVDFSFFFFFGFRIFAMTG